MAECECVLLVVELQLDTFCCDRQREAIVELQHQIDWLQHVHHRCWCGEEVGVTLYEPVFDGQLIDAVQRIRGILWHHSATAR